LFQHERSQKDLAAGIQAALRPRGAIKLSELSLELRSLCLESFESGGFLLVDRGKLGLDFLARCHGV
jgi:hypothetical protein